jgi:hypothetical protein
MLQEICVDTLGQQFQTIQGLVRPDLEVFSHLKCFQCIGPDVSSLIRLCSSSETVHMHNSYPSLAKIFARKSYIEIEQRLLPSYLSRLADSQ